MQKKKELQEICVTFGGEDEDEGLGPQLWHEKDPTTIAVSICGSEQARNKKRNKGAAAFGVVCNVTAVLPPSPRMCGSSAVCGALRETPATDVVRVAADASAGEDASCSPACTSWQNDISSQELRCTCTRVPLLWKECVVPRRENAYMEEGCMLLVHSVWRRCCAAPAEWNRCRICAPQRLPATITTFSWMLKPSVNMQYVQFANSLHSGRHTLPVVPERSAEEPGQRYSRGRQSPNKAFNALVIDPFTEINSEILAGPESHFEGTP